jgi:hypothetical protein
VPVVTTVIEQLNGSQEYNVVYITVGLTSAFMGMVLTVLILPND